MREKQIMGPQETPLDHLSVNLPLVYNCIFHFDKSMIIIVSTELCSIDSRPCRPFNLSSSSNQEEAVCIKNTQECDSLFDCPGYTDENNCFFPDGKNISRGHNWML